MRLSKSKRDKLYSVIHNPIMDLRVELNMNPTMSQSDIDAKLFQLEAEIWDKVKNTLGLDNEL